jgi:hypothetical protein
MNNENDSREHLIRDLADDMVAKAAQCRLEGYKKLPPQPSAWRHGCALGLRCTRDARTGRCTETRGSER